MSIKKATLKGRKQLFTEYLPNHMRPKSSTAPLLDETTIPKILEEAWNDISITQGEIQYLLDYYRGDQDILERVKEVRPDVDNRVVFNHALAITRDIVGYTFGKPIRYVPRSDKARRAVSELNKMVEAEDKYSSDQELATYASICGTSYRGVFPDAYGLEDEVPFTLTTLDPRNTFVIYSSEIGHPPVMAGVFYSIPSRELSGERFVYLIYTHDYIYRYENDGALVGVIEPSDLVYSQINILGEIPIVEYPNNVFRLGDWEIAKELLDAINVVGSDSVNDLQQFVHSLLVAVNVELNDTHKKDIQENKLVSIVSSKELPAELKYISEQLDAGSAQELRDWLLEQMRLIVGIPSRDARGGGGGDTGDAVYLRDGFQQLEIVARTKETFFKRAERATLRLLVSLAQKEGQLKKLAVKDIDIRFSRNMTDGILSKANAISILHSTNVLDPTDVLSLVGVTTEPDELVKRGELYWKDEPKKDDVKVKEITPNDPQLLRKTDRE